MKNWADILILPDKTIKEALLQIDITGARMVIVVNSDRKLLGTLTDGDIRRGILKGLSLSEEVQNCMWADPCTAQSHEKDENLLVIMKQKKIHQLPILDVDGRVVGVKTLDEYVLPKSKENLVVLVAGGLGSRLGQLTKSMPKPMLKVGEKPLLEITLRNFMNQGFRNFCFSVNYKADIIENHFGNGECFGVQITYLRESKRLGTAGALGLIAEKPIEPIIVANGDLLTNADYSQMLDAHVNSHSFATMGVSEYQHEIPYGVVREEDGLIKRIDEKPLNSYLVSAGINVLSPDVLKYVPRNVYLDMPNLFEKIISDGLKASIYRVNGYWLDIGRETDYLKANEDIDKTF